MRFNYWFKVYTFILSTASSNDLCGMIMNTPHKQFQQYVMIDGFVIIVRKKVMGVLGVKEDPDSPIVAKSF